MTESSAPAPASPPAARNPQAVVAVLAFTGITVSVMQTLVVPLIVSLPKLLHTSTSNAEWVITSTLLAAAVATPVTGRLGDMYGKRRIVFASLALLVVGSLVCAVTSSLIPMVAGRALQGGAMGAVPLGISIMRDVLPPERMGSAMALMSSSLGVGGALGLPGSALVAQHLDWHFLFYGSAGLGVVAIALVAAFVPVSPVRAGGRFDYVGTVGLAAGLISLLMAISKGGDWGWGSATTLGCFGAAAAVLAAWGLFELKTPRPLVDLRTTVRRPVLLTNISAVAVGFAMYAMSLILPQLLQLPKQTGYGLGQSMVSAGLCIMPGGIVMIVISPLSARLSRARGPKVSLMAGAAVIGAGYLLGLVLLHAAWQIAVVSCVIGAGIALAYAAMPALIMSSVPLAETAAANGLNSLMRSLGTSTASAVVGVVLAHETTPFGGVPLPSMTGFRIAFVIAAGAAVASVLVAAAIPTRRPALAGAADSGTDPGAGAGVADGEPAAAPIPAPAGSTPR